MTTQKSYAETLRETLEALPIKKKCCVHAARDAEQLWNDDVTSEQRVEAFSVCAKHVKCPSCMQHYIRRIFLTVGSVTDPLKQYHLDMTLHTEEEADALQELLLAEGQEFKKSARKNVIVLYLKNGEQIADFLAYIGANTAAFDFMNSKIEREFRNNVNRQVNCDTANIEKALLASGKQISVIRTMMDTGVINKLPESLRITAELRVKNEQMSMKELGEAHNPPITKSGVNHRLSKIMDIALANGIE